MDILIHQSIVIIKILMPPSCTHEDVYQNFPLTKIHLSNSGIIGVDD